MRAVQGRIPYLNSSFFYCNRIQKKMRVGVIDLGTNTFNLLIADIQKDATFKPVLNTKLPVMLGKPQQHVVAQVGRHQ